jgi:hypothetical protein
MLACRDAQGYQNFMSWIKGEIIKGNYVTIGVLLAGGSSSNEYEHIVNVVGVDSNSNTAAFNAEDVLWIEDHGASTQSGATPAVPPGAGSSSGCAPLKFGYAFSAFSSYRSHYGIPLPTSSIKSYGYSISGVQGEWGA